MSDSENRSVPRPERFRHYQYQIHNYLRRSTEIRNKGYINDTKMITNVRILSLNPRGIDPWNEYKSNMFLEAIEDNHIDIIMLNETNMK